jgi:pentatricopeptide repeat protein
MVGLMESEILSQIADFIISARAELFLFVLAIAAHLLLFGNVLPRRTGHGRKQVLKEDAEEAEGRPSRRDNINTAIPEKLEECEICLQTAFSNGDYRTVLRCWGQLKKLDEAPTVNLCQVVEAMQRFKKDAASILNELRSFFKRHSERYDITAVNELLEGLSKSLDTDLSKAIVTMVKQIDIEPDSRTYEILLATYFAARDFEGVYATKAEMGAARISLTPRAYAVLFKTALRTNSLKEAIHCFREVRRSGAVSTMVEGHSHFFSQILDLACRGHELALLEPDLDEIPLSTDTVHKIFAECILTKQMHLMKKVEKLARTQEVEFTDKTYQLLLKAASSNERVVEIFNEIIDQKAGVSSDMAQIVLGACAEMQDPTIADRLFENMKPNQMPVLGALLRYYSDAGLHEKACNIYEWHLKQPGVQSMNRSLLDARTERALMNSLLKCGKESVAKGILDEAPANVAKHIAMIRDCASKKNLEGSISVFKTLKDSGGEVTRSMYNAVLDACVECGDLRRADQWMENMKKENVTDVVSYNTLVKAQVRADNFNKARVLMEEMAKQNLPPNHITYNELVNGMIRSSNCRKEQVWEVVDEMMSRNIQPNRVTCSILLKDLKAKSYGADITRTMDLINAMSEPMDEVLLSSVVEACVRVGKPDLLAQTLAQLQKRGDVVVTGAHTFGSLIKAYGHARDVNGAWRCWKEMRTRHIKPTSITIGCMVEAIVSNGDPEGALELILQTQEDVETREQVNAVIYCSVLKGFAHDKKMDRVWSVWEDMLSKGVAPSITTFNALCDACARNGVMEKVPQLLNDMKERRLTPNLITYGSILKGHCVKGDVRAAFEVLDDMRKTTNLKPDEIMYNTLLDGCAQANLAEEGLKILETMQREGIRPSNYTLSILVKLMSHARRLDQAFSLVDQLTKKYRFKPNAPVYGNLVQACLVNKDLQRGLQLLEQMAKDRITPDLRTYCCLIRTCMSSGLVDNAALVLRAALGLPCTAPYPAGSDARSGKGLEDLVNEVLNALISRGRNEDLATPIFADIRKHKPGLRVDTAIQRKIASELYCKK